MAKSRIMVMIYTLHWTVSIVLEIIIGSNFFLPHSGMHHTSTFTKNHRRLSLSHSRIIDVNHRPGKKNIAFQFIDLKLFPSRHSCRLLGDEHSWLIERKYWQSICYASFSLFISNEILLPVTKQLKVSFQSFKLK